MVTFSVSFTRVLDLEFLITVKLIKQLCTSFGIVILLYIPVYCIAITAKFYSPAGTLTIDIKCHNLSIFPSKLLFIMGFCVLFLE